MESATRHVVDVALTWICPAGWVILPVASYPEAAKAALVSGFSSHPAGVFGRGRLAILAGNASVVELSERAWIEVTHGGLPFALVSSRIAEPASRMSATNRPWSWECQAP